MHVLLDEQDDFTLWQLRWLRFELLNGSLVYTPMLLPSYLHRIVSFVCRSAHSPYTAAQQQLLVQAFGHQE
jgi:hypothetical protein